MFKVSKVFLYDRSYNPRYFAISKEDKGTQVVPGSNFFLELYSSDADEFNRLPLFEGQQ